MGSRQGGIPLHVERDPVEEVTPPHPAIYPIQKPGKAPTRGVLCSSKSIHLAPLWAQNLHTPRKYWGHWGLSSSTVSSPHPGESRRSAAWPKSAIEALRFRPNRRGGRGAQRQAGVERGKQRTRGGQACLSGQSDGLAFTRALLRMLSNWWAHGNEAPATWGSESSVASHRSHLASQQEHPELRKFKSRKI